MEIAELKAQYEQRLPIYQSFCKYFEQECRCLLEKVKLSYYELSFRIKSWESIVGKIERQKLSPMSIEEIYDVIGFRIIVLFKRDIDIICNVIKRECQVLYVDDKSQTKPEDVFGYLSVHYEVALRESWLGSPSTFGFENIQFEIQVRTFSQHVWAASSHLLQYKMEDTVPVDMRRSIYRLAAVLEIVDNELENIREFRDEYRNNVREFLQNQNQEQGLDIIVVEGVLDQFFPQENKRTHEPFDLMVSELFAVGIKTIEQLERLLDEQMEYVIKKEQKRMEECGHPFYSYIGLLRIAISNMHKSI